VSGYLTMGQAAKVLRIPGRFAGVKTRRMLIARQRTCRQKIVWFRGTGRGRRAYTTEVALRRNLPELFDHTDEIAARLRVFFRKINQDVAALRLEVAEIRATNKLLADAYKRRFGVA